MLTICTDGPVSIEPLEAVLRSHSALYVDAGYLIAAAATRTTGSSFRRGVEIDFAALLAELIRTVETQSGLPILRVYWYDAARDSKATSSQEQIALLPKVKLRLGRVGVEGEQKGVDLRIGLDMVGHSRNGAVDSMYLLSGDDDLTEAVEEAQAQGVQVIVLAVPSRSGARHGVSRHLMLAADDLEMIAGELLDKCVRTVGASIPPEAELMAPAGFVPSVSPADVAKLSVAPLTVAPSAPDLAASPSLVYSSSGTALFQDVEELSDTIHEVANKTYEAWATAATREQVQELKTSRPSIPRDLDRALLVDLSDAIGEYTLSDAVRFSLRSAFWLAVDKG